MRIHLTPLLACFATAACGGDLTTGDPEGTPVAAPAQITQEDTPKPAAPPQEAPRRNRFEIQRGDAQSPSESSNPEIVRVVQWNIKSGRDSSIEAIATQLTLLQADVIVLQEVDCNTIRTGRVDQPSVLARSLGLYYAFAPTIPWSGGLYGITTLSRYPFTTVQRITLSNAMVIEPRTALDVTLQLPAATLRIVNHHADTVPAAAAQSTSEILENLRASFGSGIALLGDFNQVPTDQGPRACVEAGLVDLGQQYGDLATTSGRRIDYIFADTSLAACVQEVKVEPVSTSDHNALVADIDLACLQAQAM